MAKNKNISLTAEQQQMINTLNEQKEIFDKKIDISDELFEKMKNTPKPLSKNTKDGRTAVKDIHWYINQEMLTNTQEQEAEKFIKKWSRATTSFMKKHNQSADWVNDKANE